MIGSPSTTDALLDLLRRLKRERREVEQKITEIDSAITAVETTVGLLARELAGNSTGPAVTIVEPPVVPGETETIAGWAKRLYGKTQLEALGVIAQEYGGSARVSDAKRILVSTGLSTGNPKHLGTSIYHMISANPDKFEALGSGTGMYRLVNHPDGIGSPKNNDDCREVATKRADAITLDAGASG